MHLPLPVTSQVFEFQRKKNTSGPFYFDKTVRKDLFSELEREKGANMPPSVFFLPALLQNPSLIVYRMKTNFECQTNQILPS